MAGAFVTLRGNRSQAPEVQAVDVNGRVLADFSLRIDGASTIAVRAFTRGTNGTFAVCGFSISQDGRIGNFIDVLDESGNSQVLIRTDPVAPINVAFASDGTVWAEGPISKLQGMPIDSDSTGGVLRHFDRTGTMVKSYLPATGLNDKNRAVDGHLSSAADRVGWISSGKYSASGGYSSARYVEIGGDGMLKEYALPNLDSRLGKAAVALTLTPDGHKYMTGADGDGKVKVFSLNKQQATWTPMSLQPAFSDPNEPPVLVGLDGNSLAIWDTVNNKVLFYNPQP
jgi:hypothetical protein